jgi:ABC-2 type transport system ATP-binding protein
MQGVSKSFREKVAVDRLDLVVPRGSLCGFIGPNGAGKTTTLRMIMAILFPDAGELEVLGKPSAIESKDRIGYLPEERGVYRKMKVGSFLAYMARIKGVQGSGLASRIGGWLERVGLAEARNKRCEELSKGMQQKVQFLAAVLHDPELLILDEPFSGLDPLNMRLLRELIREQHAAGKTVIFSTHVMQQAEQICDQILMIHQGRKMLDSSMAEIRARFDPRTILVESVDAGAEATLQLLPGLRGLRRVDGAFEISLDEQTDPQQAIRAIIAAAPVNRVELRRPTLEDVFIQIVQGTGAAEAQLRAALREEQPALSAPAGA